MRQIKNYNFFGFFYKNFFDCIANSLAFYRNVHLSHADKQAESKQTKILRWTVFIGQRRKICFLFQPFVDGENTGGIFVEAQGCV